MAQRRPRPLGQAEISLAPAALPAVTLLAALAAARGMLGPAIPCGVALLGTSLAASAGVRRLLAPAALGLIVGWSSLSGAPAPDPERPAVVVGRLDGRWRREPDGASAWLAACHFRQGRSVVAWPQRVLVVLPPDAAPPPSSRLRVQGYLRRAPPLGDPAPLAPGPWAVWVKAAAFVRADGGEQGPAAWSRSAGERVERALLAHGDTPGIRLARALVLGESRALPEDWLQGLRRVGLSHALSLSGLHVALVAALGLRLGAALPATLRWLLATGAVALYTLVGGGAPSLLRASAMATVPVAAWAAGRRSGTLNALAVVATALVLARPAWVEDLGFRLTVLATAGLVWMAPRFAAGWGRLPPWLARGLGATLGAQLSTLPVVLGAFRVVSPWAPVWNLVAVPWLAPALAGCLAFAGLAVAIGPGAHCLVPLLDLLAAPFGWPAALPTRGLVALAPPAWLGLAGAAAALWALGRPRRTIWAAAVGLGAAFLVPQRGASPELHLLDVGQGEAILLRDGPRAALVDGGGWRHGDIARRVTVPALAALGVRRLDAIVLSHPDEDHCRGLAQLAGALPVRELWLTPGWDVDECLRRLSTRPGLRLRPWRAGERRSIGRWALDALHPRRPAGSDNDRSLVVMASAGRRRVLLTGDLEAAGERALLAALPEGALRADVLKVAHHGSKTSTGSALLAAVQPRLALVSAGRENRYGHPAAEVVRRIEASSARILRTDRDGWIRLGFPAGGRIEIATPAAPPG